VDLGRDRGARRGAAARDRFVRAEQEKGGNETPPPSRRRKALRSAGVVALLLVATFLPALPTVLRIQTVLGDEPSFGDLATEEMATLEAAHGERRLGQWSQYDFFQPGPALFYLLVPAYAASGFHASGLSVGCFLLSWFCIVALLGVCSLWLERWSGLVLMLPMLVAVLGYLRTGQAHFFFNWWNNFMIALPFAVLLLLAAGVSSGQAHILPWLVGVASFIAQTQMAAFPTALAVTVVSLGFLLTEKRLAGRGQVVALFRPALASGAVLAVFWFLPFLDEIHRSPGNAERMLAFVRQPHALQTPLDTLRAVAQSLAAPFAHVMFGVKWLEDFRGFPLRVAAALAVLQVLGLLVAGVRARRRGARVSARLCELGLIAIGAALWSVAQIPGPINRYLLLWIALLGTVNWVAVGNELGQATLRRASVGEDRARRPLWVFASIVSAGLLLILVAPEPRRLGPPGTIPLRENVRAFLRDRPGPVRLETLGSTWPWATAIAPALYQDGRRPCFDSGLWITDWWTCRDVATTIRFTSEPPPARAEGQRVLCQSIVPEWEGISTVCVDFVPPAVTSR
jgi:hypothetical protein